MPDPLYVSFVLTSVEGTSADPDSCSEPVAGVKDFRCFSEFSRCCWIFFQSCSQLAGLLHDAALRVTKSKDTVS